MIAINSYRWIRFQEIYFCFWDIHVSSTTPIARIRKVTYNRRQIYAIWFLFAKMNSANATQRIITAWKRKRSSLRKGCELKDSTLASPTPFFPLPNTGTSATVIVAVCDYMEREDEVGEKRGGVFLFTTSPNEITAAKGRAIAFSSRRPT